MGSLDGRGASASSSKQGIFFLHKRKNVEREYNYHPSPLTTPSVTTKQPSYRKEIKTQESWTPRQICIDKVVYSLCERFVESLKQDWGVSVMLEWRESRLRGVWEREVPWREKARLDMGERSPLLNCGDSHCPPVSTLRYRSRLLMLSVSSSSLYGKKIHLN